MVSSKKFNFSFENSQINSQLNNRLLPFLTPVSLKKNQYLGNLFCSKRFIGIVASGCFQQLIKTNNLPIAMDFYFPAQAFSHYENREFELFTSKGINYQALENSELFVLDFDQILDSKIFQLAFDFHTTLSEIEKSRLIEVNQILRFSTPLEKFNWLAEFRPAFMSRLPNYALANYLGIAPETYSRLRSKRFF